MPFELFWPVWFSSRLLPFNLSDTAPPLSTMPTLLCTTWNVVTWLKLSAWTQGRTEERTKAPQHSYAEGQGGSRRGPGCHFRLHSNVSLSIFRSGGSALIESVITVTNTTKMFLFNGMAVRNLSQAENYNEVKPQWCWHTHALSQVECVAAACDSVKHTSDPDKRWLKILKKGAWNYFCTHVHVNV